MDKCFVLHASEKLRFFDNGGATFDRYTIVYPGEDFFDAMSHNPLYPGGVWATGRLPCFISTQDKEVTYNDLPLEVQQAVNFVLRKSKHEILVDDN